MSLTVHSLGCQPPVTLCSAQGEVTLSWPTVLARPWLLSWLWPFGPFELDSPCRLGPGSVSARDPVFTCPEGGSGSLPARPAPCLPQGAQPPRPASQPSVPLASCSLLHQSQHLICLSFHSDAPWGSRTVGGQRVLTAVPSERAHCGLSATGALETRDSLPEASSWGPH